VPCKKSKLGARAARTLAERHLRPDPGGDADAKRFEYRANVLNGGSEPGNGKLSQYRGAPHADVVEFVAAKASGRTKELLISTEQPQAVQ
jgi:hypothetical protein